MDINLNKIMQGIFLIITVVLLISYFITDEIILLTHGLLCFIISLIFDLREDLNGHI